MSHSPVDFATYKVGQASNSTACVQFIYISKEEMQAVADFIRRRGRVSVAELAAKSNTFIDLEEKAARGNEAIDLDLDEVSKSDS